MGKPCLNNKSVWSILFCERTPPSCGHLGVPVLCVLWIYWRVSESGQLKTSIVKSCIAMQMNSSSVEPTPIAQAGNLAMSLFPNLSLVFLHPLKHYYET
jgi:hypothetical protein